jgi:DNA-binding LacI/PurR family transcriptional regulator
MAASRTPPNIFDVARLAGVSKSTVSRVLNGSDRVSEASRQAVLRAMEELGFRPNSAARRLAGSADRRIGLLLPFFGSMFSSFYVYEIIRGVGQVVSERDTELLLHFQHEDRNGDDLRRRLTANGALGGWVIADEMVDDALLEEVREAGIPFVLLNRESSVPWSSWATVDNRGAAVAAVEHLVSLGHTRIATLTGPLHQPPARERLEGFREAMAARGLQVPDSWVARCDFQRQLAAEETVRMLRESPRPTAIFAASDLMAAGAYEAASSLGLRIPEDLSVVGFDDDCIAAQLLPRLTTVRQPLQDAARAATSWLLDHLEDRNGQPLRVRLPAFLVERESCAPPRLGDVGKGI